MGETCQRVVDVQARWQFLQKAYVNHLIHGLVRVSYYCYFKGAACALHAKWHKGCGITPCMHETWLLEVLILYIQDRKWMERLNKIQSGNC